MLRLGPAPALTHLKTGKEPPGFICPGVDMQSVAHLHHNRTAD